MKPLIIPPKDFWKKFKETPGALSCAEALAIIQISDLVSEGTYMEIGSHRGKSGMSAAVGLKKGALYAVDPIFEDVGIADAVTDLIFDVNFGNIAVIAIADYSVNVIDKHAPYSYIFWDSGEHAGEVLKRETELLEDALISGGILCSHDIGNQFTQQKEALDYLVSTGKYEWIYIDWQPIFDYVKENNLEEGNNSWHLYPELSHPPNFIGALRRK
mgnify:FL=1